MQTAHSAEQLLRKAEEIMTERGKQYDSTGQNRERSMGRIVAAFNALYGTQLTEQQGWHFMVLLKLARQETKPHADSMEDAIAYAALAGEAGFAALGAVRQCAVSVHPTIAALEQERDGLRNDIDKLEYAMQPMNDWRKIAESAQAETAEYRDRCYRLNTKLESLRNSLEVSEQAAQAKIQQLTNALREAKIALMQRAANANANANASPIVEHCIGCGLPYKQSIITFSTTQRVNNHE